MLEIRNLTKIYDDGTRALHDVSFTMPDGEFLVVIGLKGVGALPEIKGSLGGY